MSTEPEKKLPEKAETAPEGPKAKGKKNKKEKEKKTPKQEIMSWILTLLAAVVIALLILALLFEPIRVDGESMRDTLQDNEIVLVTKPDYLAGNFNRGDVIICRYPNRNSKTSLQLGGTLEVSFVNHTLFVKRLIALPGDLLQIVEGAVYVNGELVDESNINMHSQSRTNLGPYRLGEDEYFVMGDNRGNSNDSRAVGPISRDMIVGHVRCVLWPLNKLGTKVE